MTAREFLTLLWQYKPEEHYILVWTLQGKRSHWFQSIEKAAEFVEQTTGVDLYVGMGLSKEPVSALGFEERFYNLSDIEEFLDECGIPNPEAEERAAKAWNERFHGKEIVVNPAARIPDDLIAAWMDPANSDKQTAMRFKNTWLRQRHDLKDQSNSGYDMALADFGVDAGLSEQLIVDLIVHHRYLHKQKFRNRVDYYQRTIAKAEERVEANRASVSLAQQPAAPAPAPPATTNATAADAAPQAARVAPEAAEAAEPTTPQAPDADAARAALCGRISDALAIRVLRLVKITGKEPQYRLELADGQKIEFPSVMKLLAYDSVRAAIAGTVGKIIPKIKGKRWEELSQLMLDACVVEEGTEEMDWVGATRMHLEHYLSETGFIPSIEGQMIQHQRKPMVIDGCVTVCTSDFQTYVNKTTFQNLSVKAVAGMLSALGAKSIRVRGGAKFKDQSRWSLPLNEFDPNEYPQPEQMGQPEGVPF